MGCTFELSSNKKNPWKNRCLQSGFGRTRATHNAWPQITVLTSRPGCGQPRQDPCPASCATFPFHFTPRTWRIASLRSLHPRIRDTEEFVKKWRSRQRAWAKLQHLCLSYLGRDLRALGIILPETMPAEKAGRCYLVDSGFMPAFY